MWKLRRKRFAYLKKNPQYEDARQLKIASSTGTSYVIRLNSRKDEHSVSIQHLVNNLIDVLTRKLRTKKYFRSNAFLREYCETVRPNDPAIFNRLTFSA